MTRTKLHLGAVMYRNNCQGTSDGGPELFSPLEGISRRVAYKQAEGERDDVDASDATVLGMNAQNVEPVD